MKVYVNNEPREISEQTSLFSLLSELSLSDAKGIAVAVNDEIIFRQNWSSHPLQENDKLTVIRATQGG